MLAIKDLNSSAVEQAEATLVQFIRDELPSADLTKGRVLYDLLIRPAALFHALNGADMDRLRRSMSIQQISQNPTLANDDIVDGVLSNLMLTRNAGAPAAGQVRIVITSRVTTPIDSDLILTANSNNYTPTRAFVGVTSQTGLVNTGSRLIVERADGLFEFIIDVEAVNPGSAANIAEGTRFTASRTINRLVDISAASDFSGGRATESNAALAARAQQGLSPRTLSGRSHIEALLRSQFPEIEALSIIGFGDVEMRRDAHNLLGVSSGGKVDIYARTALTPQRVIIELEASMTDAAEKTFSVTIGRDTAAGVYAVLGIYREDDSPFTLDDSEPSMIDSLEIVSVAWATNLTMDAGGFVPDIETDEEASFTRYRQAVVTFKDLDSTLLVGEKAIYQFYLLKMPSIAALQDFVNDRGRRGPASDYLVKAPVPALCSVGVRVLTRNTEEVDTSAILNAIVNRVNQLGFSVGKLPGSVIIDAAQGQLPKDAILDLPLNMFATLHLPDGSKIRLSGTDELSVPDTGFASVSSRTVGWFLRTTDVDISVEELTTPET